MKIEHARQLFKKPLTESEFMHVTLCVESQLISSSQMKRLEDIADKYGVKWRPNIIEKIFWRIRLWWWLYGKDLLPWERRKSENFKKWLTTPSKSDF